MSPLYQLAVFQLLCLSSALAELAWDDPCNNISPVRGSRPNPHNSNFLNFTKECPEGRIRWDYPQGTFQINFTPVNKAPFRICLKAGNANFIHEMFSLVDGNKITVAIPTEGNDSCVQSHDNQVQLILVAPPELYYATWIDFVTTLS